MVGLEGEPSLLYGAWHVGSTGWTGPALDVKGLEAPRRSPDQLTYSAPTLDGSPAESGKAKAAKSATVSG